MPDLIRSAVEGKRVFTGIVAEMLEVKEVRSVPAGKRIVLARGETARERVDGSSIAVNGACLTLVESDRASLHFDAVHETLERTNLGGIQTGDRVNIEYALRANDELGGHFVSGHVDGTGTVEAVTAVKGQEENVLLWIRTDPDMMKRLVPKGSICIDGVSLTLVDVEEERFSITIIPFTLKHTTLGQYQSKRIVNIELDMIGKQIERYLDVRRGR